MKVEKKSIVPVPPPEEYVITLNKDEAMDLFHLLGAMGGINVNERDTTFTPLYKNLRKVLALDHTLSVYSRFKAILLEYSGW